jgi:hypothetical protein
LASRFVNCSGNWPGGAFVFLSDEVAQKEFRRGVNVSLQAFSKNLAV